MIRPKPSEQWERFGREDPYYGVYTVDEFRGRSLDDDVRERFFASGEEQLGAHLARAAALVGHDVEPHTALEYGCGVGRLLIPLARRSQRAVGLDVSPSMLAEARRNAVAAGVDTLTLEPAAALDRLDCEFDFVLCALVLQHMPVRDGEHVFGRFVELLRPGGVGVVQVTIGAARAHAAFNLAMKLPLAANLLNVVRGRPWDYPHMHMNVYSLNRLVAILRERGVEVVHAHLEPRFGGYDSATLVFAR